MRHVKLTVRGKVQGVYFRASAKDKADELKIKGFVRNEPDSSVYIEAEGNDDAVQKLVSWCHTGPPRARVEKVEIKEGEVAGFENFEIRKR
jgi:acylphosphatase